MNAYCYRRNIGGRLQPAYYTTRRGYSTVWKGHGTYTFEGTVGQLEKAVAEGRAVDLPWR